ncbi:MAG: FAD-dependent oxidoreductase, partial [Planctomycetales bacterium]|nr:FAD-dependent oxidoreductase [Planctomycetales bacterium]
MVPLKPPAASNSDPNFTRRSVVVVGGGLAGTSAAMALLKNGISVCLLESKSRLGGRTGSFKCSNLNAGHAADLTDYCQHVGMGCCTNLLQLVDWLGHGDCWDRQRELHFYGPTGTYQRLAAAPLLPAPLHLASWLLKWPGLTWKDRVAIAQGLFRLNRLESTDEIDSQSALAWLHNSGQTQRAIELFWSTIVVSALGARLSNVSMAAVCKVLQDGFLRHRQAFHLLVPKLPLDTLFNIQMREALLSLGGEVQLRTTVRALCRNHSSGKVDLITDARPFSADAVVLAVPWHQLRNFGQTRELGESIQHAESFACSPITGIHTWWDRPWLLTPHACLVGRTCQWVFPQPSANKHHGSV